MKVSPLIAAALVAPLGLALVGCDAASNAATVPDVVDMQEERLTTFITPDLLDQLQAELGDDLVLVDARSPDAYASGHLPGAINLPGKTLRTGKAKPGEGDSQYLFLDDAGQPDIARYERLLGDAGISRDKSVVVYGNHAGKGDGTIPAMVLDWLGQERVYFLDGVGIDVWLNAGREVETEPTTLPIAEYVAEARPNFVWNLADVQAALASPESDRPVFYDTRSLGEFDGTTLRSNARGGHIPGAIHADYAEMLDENKQLRPLAEIESILERHGLPDAKAAGRPIVLYCQTATRVSLPYLVLRELGYDHVAIYDASWHEYGNRDDTEIDSPQTNGDTEG
ncbi:MAG: rhodanese-like domain-containing protein [Planctomycetota bacterium]